MEFSKIHWHDLAIKKVVELPSEERLLFEVDYPVDWENLKWEPHAIKWEPHTIEFDDLYTYEIHEGPFVGSPTILGATKLGIDEHGNITIKLDTNAGYRIIKCKKILITEEKIYG
ncbi:hypothetical protein ACFL9U_16360 [Thermodesulfobacteriota bacterium]